MLVALPGTAWPIEYRVPLCLDISGLDPVARINLMRVVMVVEGYNAVGGIAEIVDSLAVEMNRAGHTTAILSTRDFHAERYGYERHPRPGIECIYQQIWNRKPVGLRHLET